jgi:hypothetical protein
MVTSAILFLSLSSTFTVIVRTDGVTRQHYQSTA